MELSTLALIITGIFAVLAFGFIVAAILISENNIKKIAPLTLSNSTPIYSDIFEEIHRDFHQLIHPPKFQRLSPKSTEITPLSTAMPPFMSLESTAMPTKYRSIKEKISPSHQRKLSGLFEIYPYLGSIDDTGFIFTLPLLDIGQGNHPNDHKSPAQNFTSDGPGIKIGSTGNKIVSCDIVDIDALVETVVFQYKIRSSRQNQEIPMTKSSNIGSITMPLAKGSPFITIEIKNISITLDTNFEYLMTTHKNSGIYVLKINSVSGYAIFLPTELVLTRTFDTVIIPKMTGVIRIAYFDSPDTLEIISKYSNIYPVEATISTSASENSGKWHINTSFIWTTKNMLQNKLVKSPISPGTQKCLVKDPISQGTFLLGEALKNTKSKISQDSNNELLMVALPHHNIVNLKYESELIDHALIGPFRFVVADKGRWILSNSVTNHQFNYPVILDQHKNNKLLAVWKKELKNISELQPLQGDDWAKWISDLANLLLIGQMLKQNIISEIKILKDELDKIRIKDGKVSAYNTFIYDKGNIINKLGPDNYGYIIFGYAVACYFDRHMGQSEFLQNNKDIALCFVRDVMNPCQYDILFPLWKDKNWYLGYSEGEIGENIMKYYGCFLMSIVVESASLTNWSLAMLSSEISAYRSYFYVQDTNFQTKGLKNTEIFSAERLTVLSMINPITLDYINEMWGDFDELIIE
jgi:hypothetical protein